ncbi:hypothetical protein PsorP6_011619 [Peronosclerospora sorghi]|uniref:Uncharacterized protein n=1 Tax=Peronosclerospora sorghi TaxID=230839 RepID=A0ACC0WKX2_9STRA|nr:hypothetical protein PsorP6_011619 [Peronosclerospora sorghi]
MANEVSLFKKQVKEIDRIQDPMQWWALQVHVFPNIARLSRCTLCVPATSAPSERAFSQAGLIITDNRRALSGENVGARSQIQTQGIRNQDEYVLKDYSRVKDFAELISYYLIL